MGRIGKQGEGWWWGKLIKARKKSKSVGLKDGKHGMGGMENWGLGENSELR